MCVVLLLSAFLTWREDFWINGAYIKIWLLTASGLFAELYVPHNNAEKVEILLIGTVNLLAMFSYVIRPSKITIIITILGFIAWQFLGFLGTRLGFTLGI
jgi:hypothetical protein